MSLIIYLWLYAVLYILGVVFTLLDLAFESFPQERKPISQKMAVLRVVVQTLMAFWTIHLLRSFH